MMKENGMWCCSVDDDEHFGPAQFETREAALRDAMQMAKEEGAYPASGGGVPGRRPGVCSSYWVMFTEKMRTFFKRIRSGP